MAIAAGPTRFCAAAPIGFPSPPRPNWESFEPVRRKAIDTGAGHLDVIADELRPRLAEASQLTESLRLYDSSYQTELDW